MLFGLLKKHFTISSWTVSGDRCMPQWFKQKHNAQKLQFPSPGGLCIRDRLMWGKSRNKWSQVIKGIINFLRSSLTPCFFLLMSPVWWLRMLAMLSTETYFSVCSFCFGGTNLTFDVSWFFFCFSWQRCISLQISSFVTGLKSFSLIEPFVASYLSIVKFWAAKLDNPHLFSDSDSHLWNCLVRFRKIKGLLCWFTELCVVEVLHLVLLNDLFTKIKRTIDLKTYLLNCGSHCRPQKQRARLTADHVRPNKFPIYREIISMGIKLN